MSKMALSQPKTLAEAANSDDIEALYTLLKQNPSLLEEIGGIPFVDTPLHLAAASGSTHFAIEVLSLKPSFGKKLNPSGFSPMHLALRYGNAQTVRRLLECDSELIRVKGREGCTPLHYVAEVDDLLHLALFLEANPKAIQDLNIRKETAVHVALKSGNSNAFMVLLGWLTVTRNLDILNWKDEKDNTALHVAVSTNNYEVLSYYKSAYNWMRQNIRKMVRLLIIPVVRINQQNQDGLTALDIAKGVANSRNIIEKKLVSAGAKTRVQLPPPQIASSQYTTIAQRIFSYKLRAALLSRKIVTSISSFSEETRSNLMVVTGLIIAATYQAVLSAPSGLTSSSNNGMEWYGLMLGGNSLCFILSMGYLILLLPETVFISFLLSPLIVLSASYGFSYGLIRPGSDSLTAVLQMGALFGIFNIPFIWLKVYCLRNRN